MMMKRLIRLRIRSSISFLLDRKVLGIILILLVLAAGAMVVSTGLGEMHISPLEVIKVLAGQGSELNELVIKQFRLPRIITAFLVGVALAVSGAILQGLIRNPLASPDIIGITGGASVAAVTFLTLYSDTSNNTLVVSIKWLPVAAFIGAALIAFIVYALAWKNGVSPIRLVLIGIGLSAAMQAITSLMILLGPLYLASQATIWLTGSVYASNWEKVQMFLPWIGLCLILVMLAIRHLNIQELGDDLAVNAGSKVQKNRLFLLLLSTALAGGAVAVAGGIGFVGLMAPHMARKLVGSSFGGLIPVSALLGGMIVVLADLVARMAFSPLDLPAGIFTAAIGAPYFIYLLFKSRNQ